MAAADNAYQSSEFSEMYPPVETVVEEIEEDESLVLSLGRPYLPRPSVSPSPVRNNQDHDEPECDPCLTVPLLPPDSPRKGREFGNISPISELLDDDDDDNETDTVEPETCVIEDRGVSAAKPSVALELEEGSGQVTPEPGMYPIRTSFPRISDGRSSPILAYSPSLIKSPSSGGSKSRATAISPPSGGAGVGKRPRNIARMLDNISDHSSGEEEVNNVGVMMAKFTV